MSIHIINPLVDIDESGVSSCIFCFTRLENGLVLVRDAVPV